MTISCLSFYYFGFWIESNMSFNEYRKGEGNGYRKGEGNENERACHCARVPVSCSVCLNSG